MRIGSTLWQKKMDGAVIIGMNLQADTFPAPAEDKRKDSSESHERVLNARISIARIKDAKIGKGKTFLSLTEER